MSQKLQKWVRMDKNGLVWIKMGQDGQKWDGRDGITGGVRWAAGGLVTAQRGAGCGGFGGTRRGQEQRGVWRHRLDAGEPPRVWGRGWGQVLGLNGEKGKKEQEKEKNKKEKGRTLVPPRDHRNVPRGRGIRQCPSPRVTCPQLPAAPSHKRGRGPCPSPITSQIPSPKAFCVSFPSRRPKHSTGSFRCPQAVLLALPCARAAGKGCAIDQTRLAQSTN